MKLPFTLKICGLTDIHEAAEVGSQGVAAIGLNFSRHSVRQVNPTMGRKISDAYRKAAKASIDHTSVVGVFVEQTIQQAVKIARQVGLDMIQLHGDHPLDAICEADRPVIWVLRVKSESSLQLVEQIGNRMREISIWREMHPESSSRLGAVLLDAHVDGEWGGTGKTLAWKPLRERHHWNQQGGISWPNDLPLILAGGINPDNIQVALLEACPDAIDVASGVESAPGKKDIPKIKQLLARADS